MKFTKLCAPTLKELFIQEMENLILSGELKIGEKLPSERELADSMNVSRSVVNAGLVDLSNKGFVEIIPRSGTYVMDYRRHGKLETLISIMNYNGGTFPRNDIKSILEIRIVLENLAINLALPRIKDEEVELLKGHAKELQEASSYAIAAKAVFDFHHELCVISGNTLLPLIFYSFKVPILTLWERYMRLHGIEILSSNTMELCKYIEERSIEKAIACLSNSINNTIDGSSTIYDDMLLSQNSIFST